MSWCLTRTHIVGSVSKGHMCDCGLGLNKCMLHYAVATIAPPDVMFHIATACPKHVAQTG